MIIMTTVVRLQHEVANKIVEAANGKISYETALVSVKKLSAFQLYAAARWLLYSAQTANEYKLVQEEAHRKLIDEQKQSDLERMFLQEQFVAGAAANQDQNNIPTSSTLEDIKSSFLGSGPPLSLFPDKKLELFGTGNHAGNILPKRKGKLF